VEEFVSRFAIAGIQMYVSATEDNVPMMRQRLATLMAIYPWVRMVVFSELAVSGPLPQTAQPIPGPAEEALRELAGQHELWLVSGSMYETDGNRVYNTASVIDPEGEVVGRYRKMFPFEPYEIGVSAGDEFLVFDVPEVGRFGLYICYDMWIPKTSRTLAVMILRPTLTGTIDRDVELSIARATAVTNSRVCTNHQQRVEWEDYARMSSTVERREFLEKWLMDPAETGGRFVGRFLRPPLYNTRYEQAFGTLYTAAYFPVALQAEYRWPHQETLRQSFSDFREGERQVYLGLPSIQKQDVLGD
jgi:predicted amidohydrolase